MINYEYEKTENKDIKPKGDNWEFWGMKKTPEEEIAVWRREVKQ